MKLIYRPEIDGLRAIAVGAVILYHAQITILGHQPFKGGFIGVDIFFVISGYLITSIILKDLVTTGSFSFKHFYERRVRRILPALLFVMLVSLPFAWMYLLPSSFIDFSKSILYSLGFSSNFYFHYSGQEYGAESGLLKPFLHTWSLSVEEQFYILFPIVLLFTFKYFRKYLVHILILGFIISLGLAEWTSRNYLSISFYFIHTRMWELLAGSLLAYYEINNGCRGKNKTLNLILPTLGLLLIGHSILFFNDRMFHPSFYTLSPILGVCLIIWFSNKKEIITKILSTKLFVGVGLISYSLYLWHYPIFAFARQINFTVGDIYKKILLGLVTSIISIISYYLVEKKFRNKKYQFKKLILIFIISTIILFFFTFQIIVNNGFKSRFPKIIQDSLLNIKDVVYYQKNNSKKIVLIGDSHADALAFMLNEEIKKKELSLFRFYTNLYLNNFNEINIKTKKIDKNFFESNIKIDNFLKDNSDLIIILSQRWVLPFNEKYFDNKEGIKERSNLTYENKYEPINIKTVSLIERQKYLKEGLLSQIDKIINQGHNLILVYPVPEMGFYVPGLFINKFYKLKNLNNFQIPILDGSYKVYKERNKLIFEIFDSIKNENIYRVYPHSYFCDKQIKDRCVANDKNNIFYRDDDHLSIQGSKLVSDVIMKEIEKIELKSN